MLAVTESFLSYLNEIRTFDFAISLGDCYYSFPEFQVKDYDGVHYQYVFEIVFCELDRLDGGSIQYQDCYGRKMSFEDFFEKCNPETQEHIVFHLDFFSGRLKNDC